MIPDRPKTEPLHRKITRLALLGVLALAVACGMESPSDPAALKLKKRIRAQIEHLAPALYKPLQARDQEAVRQVLIDSGQKWKDSGHQEEFAVAVLDKKGVLVSARHFLPSATGEQAPKRVAANMNLGRFKVVERVLKSKKPAAARLYLPPGGAWGEKVFVVMAPVGKGPELVGVLARFIQESTLENERISEEDFLALSFD